MMMASVFPLGERSAVNVLGSFNVENEVVCEGSMEFDGKGAMLGEETRRRGGTASRNAALLDTNSTRQSLPIRRVPSWHRGED